MLPVARCINNKTKKSENILTIRHNKIYLTRDTLIFLKLFFLVVLEYNLKEET